MNERQLRQTAYKVWIKDLINGKYIKGEGEWTPNYVNIGDKKVSRVNLICSVINKYESEDGTYIAIALDDGSGTIRVKVWREDLHILKEINVGDLVTIIGKVKMYNEEIYILPEVVRKETDFNWEFLRKLELIEMYGKPSFVSQSSFSEEKEHIEEKVSGDTRQKILRLIEKYDDGDGVDVSLVVMKSGLSEADVKSYVEVLLKEGEVYELSGKLKITG